MILIIVTSKIKMTLKSGNKIWDRHQLYSQKKFLEIIKSWIIITIKWNNHSKKLNKFKISKKIKFNKMQILTLINLNRGKYKIIKQITILSNNNHKMF